MIIPEMKNINFTVNFNINITIIMFLSKSYQMRNPTMKDSRVVRGPMTNTKTWLHRHTLTADPQQQEQELARSRMQDKQRNNWWPLIVWRLVYHGFVWTWDWGEGGWQHIKCSSDHWRSWGGNDQNGCPLVSTMSDTFFVPSGPTRNVTFSVNVFCQK